MTKCGRRNILMHFEVVRVCQTPPPCELDLDRRNCVGLCSSRKTVIWLYFIGFWSKTNPSWIQGKAALVEFSSLLQNFIVFFLVVAVTSTKALMRQPTMKLHGFCWWGPGGMISSSLPLFFSAIVRQNISMPQEWEVQYWKGGFPENVSTWNPSYWEHKYLGSQREPSESTHSVFDNGFPRRCWFRWGAHFKITTTANNKLQCTKYNLQILISTMWNAGTSFWRAKGHRWNDPGKPWGSCFRDWCSRQAIPLSRPKLYWHCTNGQRVQWSIWIWGFPSEIIFCNPLELQEIGLHRF